MENPMKYALSCPRLGMWILILLIIFGPSNVCKADQTDLPSADLIVKISRLEDLFDELDALMGPQSPTALARSMLRGSDWIDPRRPIVMAANSLDAQPSAAILVPFVSPNADFQAAFQVETREDYYLLTLPQQGHPVSSPMERVLVAAASQTPTNTVQLELAMGQLARRWQPQWQAWLKKIAAQDNLKKNGPGSITGENLVEMMTGLVDLFQQLDQLKIGLDIHAGELRLELAGSAADNSRLAHLLTQAGGPTRLSDYEPHQPMTFKMRAYPTEQIMTLMNDLFGGVYRSMGINFDELAEMAGYFTGEMAGGTAFNDQGGTYEGLAVLKPSEGLSDFAEKILLPRLEAYCRDLSKTLQTSTGVQISEPFVRTADTTIAGKKIIGFKTRMALGAAMAGPISDGGPRSIEQELRLTTVDNLLIMAPNDQRMGELIELVQSLSEKPDDSPWLSMEVQLEAYLKFLLQMACPSGKQDITIPKLGKVAVVTDMNNGQFTSTTTLKTADLLAMTTFFKQLPNLVHVQKPRSPVTSAVKASSETAVPQLQVPPVVVPDATDWIEKGCLVAAYGNDKAAVGYFQKALELDPANGQAYFNMGISLGELGQYDKALDAINNALAHNPQNGTFFYGRGRVHLLAGHKESSIADFKQAMQLGNPDAKAYMAHLQP